MATRIQKLRETVLANEPKSRLKVLTAAQMKRLVSRYPKMPAHLRDFFSQFGCGSIGQSRYMIYDLLSPDEFFDKETAAGLKGVVLIGDDFAGTHDAYDTTGRSWVFGSVGGNGRFERSLLTKNIVEHIAEWFGDADAE